MSAQFREYEFRNKIDEALKTVRTILDTTKHPQRPADTPHEYEDKYTMAEQCATGAVDAIFTALNVLGLSGDPLEGAKSWNSSKKSVSLRLSSEERCEFVKKADRKVDSKTSRETSIGLTKIKSKTVTTITEWFWNFSVDYKISIFCGPNPDQRVVLQGRSGTTQIITTSEKSPRVETRVVAPIDVDLTWFLSNMNGVSIDRQHEKCFTPRGNAEINAAVRELAALDAWAAAVDTYFRSSVFPAQKLDGKLDPSSANSGGVFVPIVPLMLPGEGGERGVLLPAKDRQAFVQEQKRSLDAKLASMAKTFPDDKQLVTKAEANILVVAHHMRAIVQRHADCAGYVQHMLEEQLIAAIGKRVTPAEFGEYMQYHARRLFAAEFAPMPFVYAIRRPDHCPEGLLTIESNLGNGAVEQPIQTIVSCQEAAAPMFFALGAATRASFMGERYLHGAIMHQFSHQVDASLRLTARARQFSSFILMVGKIASADTFEPTHAVIVQNKDDLLVPLMLEQIPSAKAFRDAIESLSPVMQRFAKAFRAMQLESTLFGVCVVEIKPQLERLLNLQPDALTKEIRLTQDLMELFIEYQIPSDLLSFDGKEALEAPQRVAEVKRHVAELRKMINESKERELAEQKQKAEFERAQRRAEQEARRTAVVCDDEYNDGAIPDLLSFTFSGSPTGGAAPSMAMAMSSAAPSSMMFESAAAPEALFDAPMMDIPQAPEAPEANVDEPADDKEPGIVEGEGEVAKGLVDYTQVPAALDAKFEKLDEDGAVRPTTIKPETTWRKKYQKALLAKPSEMSLSKDGLRSEKNKALDLLDALCRSGALPLENCQLHIVILSTHCFDKTLLETVTHDNVNPIEKVERTQLIVASEIHQREPEEMIKPSQLERVKEFNSILF